MRMSIKVQLYVILIYVDKLPSSMREGNFFCDDWRLCKRYNFKDALDVLRELNKDGVLGFGVEMEDGVYVKECISGLMFFC